MKNGRGIGFIWLGNVINRQQILTRYKFKFTMTFHLTTNVKSSVKAQQDLLYS